MTSRMASGKACVATVYIVDTPRSIRNFFLLMLVSLLVRHKYIKGMTLTQRLKLLMKSRHFSPLGLLFRFTNTYPRTIVNKSTGGEYSIVELGWKLWSVPMEIVGGRSAELASTCPFFDRFWR
jgi:hypothetical protein